ncbi:hypothetical protein HDU85_002645 [Gaertneriomyces sp. JEL0708]|nr:hypothetical protein HDU85_002645 [Gaertneriomyces sp. JEL0708]
MPVSAYGTGQDSEDGRILRSPIARTDSMFTLPARPIDYTPLISNLKSNPDARTLSYEQVISSPQMEATAIGGMIGESSASEVSFSDAENGRSVRFADSSGYAPDEPRSVMFSEMPVAAVPHGAAPLTGPPFSILKSGVGPSPVDVAALVTWSSDSGSADMTDYDDSEEGSVSDSSSDEAVIDDERELESEIDVPDTDEEAVLAAVQTGLTYETTEDLAQGANHLQNATVEDYEDMDGLLDTLDRYIKKNRFSRSIGPAVPVDLAALSRIPTKAAPAWAVEAAAAALNAPSREASSAASKEEKVNMIMAKLSEANVKKITTRVYIEDARSFKTLLLTSLMAADQIIHDVVTKFHLEQSPNWTIFELCNDLGIERPVRDWEILTDVISAWDTSTSLNAIVMKKYGYKDTVSAKAIAGKYPRVQGWMYMEVKPGKWQRKFFVLRESNIYYYKDSDQLGSESLFCGLANYDVYTLSQRKKKTPTNFCFALRSTDNIAMFENKKDYVRYLCVEKQERLYDWVLAMRLAKSEKTFADFPEVFEDYADITPKAWKRRQHESSHSARRADRDRVERKRSEVEKRTSNEPSADIPLPPREEVAQVHRKATGTSRRSTRSRSTPASKEVVSSDGDDDEPLLMRQLRQKGVAAVDDEALSFSESDSRQLQRTPLHPVPEDESRVLGGLVRKKSRSSRRQVEPLNDSEHDSVVLGSSTVRDARRSPLTEDNDLRRTRTVAAGHDRPSQRDRERETQRSTDLERNREKAKERRRERERQRDRGRDSERPDADSPSDLRKAESRYRERGEPPDAGRTPRTSRTSGHGGESKLIDRVPEPSRREANRDEKPSRSQGSMSSRHRDRDREASSKSYSASTRRRAEDGRDAKSASRSRTVKSIKPLIDISDSPNCRKCGCSEYKPSGRNGPCSNW